MSAQRKGEIEQSFPFPNLSVDLIQFSCKEQKSGENYDN
jgi:hypothetical protein